MVMNYFFSKEFYERAIAEEKKDSYYCEVSINDFKGKISLLRHLCNNISDMGIKCKDFGHEDDYRGYAIILNASLDDIKKLHARYRDNLSIEGNICDYGTYEKTLSYIRKRKEKKIKEYEERLKLFK